MNPQSTEISLPQTSATSSDFKYTSVETANKSEIAEQLWQIIRTVPDFPKSGIDFYDVTPLLLNHVDATIDAMIHALPENLLNEVDSLVAIEARGFIFGSLLAGRLGKGMILLRKPGKLPPPILTETYALEYGEDELQIQDNLPMLKVLLVDDILATGGTLKTALNLCEQAGHTVAGMLVLLDLIDLHESFGVPIYSVLER